MPIYEFECQKCKAHTEVFQKMSDKSPTKCDKCGGRLEKLISASAIQFKGSGWYVTDYAGNGKKAAEKAESDAASAGDKSDPDKSDTDKKDSKNPTRNPKITPPQRKLPKRLHQQKSQVVIKAS